MKLKDFLPAIDKKVRIEERLFEITLALTIFVLLFWSVFSLIGNYTPIIKLIYISNFLIYSSFYILLKRGASFYLMTFLYYGSILFTLAYAWLPAGGISGIILHMFVLVYVSGLLILPLRSYLVFIAITIVIVLVYSVLEVKNPGLAAPYTSKSDLIRDLVISSMILISIIGFALFIFKKAYLNDRRQLSDTIKELEVEKEKALAADNAKSEFLATISHEMRTPLNGIVGLAELLSETELNEDQKEMLDNLNYSSKILYNLISDILDLTMIESGKLVLHSNEISVENELGLIVETLKPRLKDKELEVSLNVEHDHRINKVLKGDVFRFRQILINLTNNAIKFTEKGAVRIKSEFIKEDQDLQWIKVSVEDTGRGIAKDRQELLFSKFYKADTDINIEGTGLGLSICKNLVSIMGGEIGFQSAEGKGSEFYFTLPLKKVEFKENKAEETAYDIDKFARLKLLIAEDVRVNQMVIKKMVQNLGLTDIDVAANGEEALEMALNKKYDIILMDVQMPVMNGVESAAEITGKLGDERPVIIAVTANVMKSDLEHYRNAGMKDLLSKPVTSVLLKEVLEKYI